MSSENGVEQVRVNGEAEKGILQGAVDAIKSRSDLGSSLIEGAENLKSKIQENVELMKGNTKEENIQFLKDAVYNAAETARTGINNAMSENSEVQKNLNGVKNTVQKAASRVTEMGSNVLENLDDLKNTVKGSEIYQKTSQISVDDVKKAIQEKSEAIPRGLLVQNRTFMQGPGKTAPPSSVLYLIRDAVWLYVLGIVVLFQTLLGKFTAKKEKDLKGKVVLITGAANGLGKEVAIQLAKEGCKIICVDLKAEFNKDTEDGILYFTKDKDSFKSYGCDVSKTEEVKQLAENVKNDFGGVDILISNAGVIYGHSILKGEDDAIRKVIDVNLLANFWMVRAFLPMMRERKSGHIVFTNSATGINAIANASSYSASKHGLLGLAFALDEELRGNPEYENIKISSVCPYFINTHPAYTKLWRLRIPPISVEKAASDFITGIKREKFLFATPNVENGILIANLIKLLPTELYRVVRDVIYTDVLVNEDGESKPKIADRPLAQE